jgi:hypothetical protein
LDECGIHHKTQPPFLEQYKSALLQIAGKKPLVGFFLYLAILIWARRERISTTFEAQLRPFMFAKNEYALLEVEVVKRTTSN